MDATELQRELVDRLTRSGRLRSEPVAEAFRAVPRHHFLPGVDLARAYQDVAVPTKWAADGRPISSSSQPAIMAAMLEQLDVRPGHRVLEIGAGTGWNAALLAHLTGTAGWVTTVDIDQDIVDAARDHLRAAGVTGVEAVRGDGALGWPAGAPYDRIILTVAAGDLAPAWRAQLGGRLVLPLALRGVQHSVAFERTGDCLTSVSVVDCGFMELRGSLAGPRSLQPVEPGLFLEVEQPVGAVDLRVRGEPVPAADAVPAEAARGLRLWLALHEPAGGALIALDRPLPVPPVVSGGGMAMTVVVVGDGALGALVPAGDGAVAVQAYGTGDGPAERLLAAVRAWDAAGRPTSAGLRIRACAPGTDPAGAATVDTPRTRFLLDRP